MEIARATENLVSVIQRPDAPYDLTDAQSEEWWAIVNRLPADWFPRETHGLLADYCRHVVRSSRVAQMVTDAENEPEIDLLKLDRLYKMAERESRAASSLATRLRISQQSTRSAKEQKPMMVDKPWQ